MGNIAKTISIILFLVFLILGTYTLTKMAYSVGYEDGENGIISLLQIQQQTGGQIYTLPTQSQDTTRKIIYFILNGFKG